MRITFAAAFISILLLTKVLAGIPPEPIPLPVGAPMFYSAGNDVGFQAIVPTGIKELSRQEAANAISRRASIAKQAGITSMEPYAKWWLCEPEQGKWDFSYYDLFDQAVKNEGIRWLPFIIAGPSYATPPWFKASKESVFSRCLEHDQETTAQSIWNPYLRPRVSDYLRQFAEHFDAERIESILIGISGDFGETLYTQIGNIWTYLGPPYHGHPGYWCGESYARNDFRRAMADKYKDIKKLNAAWKTTFDEFNDIEPFVPEKASNRRARLDLQRWYCAAMTNYLEFWLNETRRYFPKSRILVAVGGDGWSTGGADFSAQAEVAAKYNAGLRVTNEGSDYATNFMWTRQVVSACRFNNIYFGIEPAGEVTTEGIPVRVYNSTASGADELFTYDPEPEGERAQAYSDLRKFLIKREPVTDVGLFLNRTSWDLDKLHRYWQAGMKLRSVTDFDIIDERLISAGVLKQKRVFFWLDGPIVEQSTARLLYKWVREGGILVVQNKELIETVEGSQIRWLAGTATGSPKTPDRYKIDVGNSDSETNLIGLWQGQEKGNGFEASDDTYRWSTDGSQAELPIPGNKGITVAVKICANGPRVRDQLLMVDNKVVAHPDKLGVQTLSFRLSPKQIAGRSSIRLVFGGITWQGSESDTRQLGVAVTSIAVGSGYINPAELDDVGILGFTTGINIENIILPPYTKRLGRGAVIYLPMSDLKMEDAAREVVYRSDRFLPTQKVPYPMIESDYTVYVTRFRDSSVLFLNSGDAEAHAVYDGSDIVIPPHSIKHKPE